MEKIAIKVVIIIMMSILVISSLNIKVFATPEQFDISAFESEDGGEAGEATQRAMATALSIAKVITTGIALIMLTILATKYMVASAGERAEIKKHAVVYVVGAIVMFSASGILTIIEKFAGNLNAS